MSTVSAAPFLGEYLPSHWLLKHETLLCLHISQTVSDENSSQDFQEIQNVANVLLIKSSQEMGSVLAVVSIEELQLNTLFLVVVEGCVKRVRNARETVLRSQIDIQTDKQYTFGF